jgi:hypothetical protein
MVRQTVFRAVRWLMRDQEACAWWELRLPRWTRHIWQALGWLDSLRWRFRSVLLFWSAAWNFSAFDWAFSFEFLRIALLENAKHFERGCATDAARMARECRIAAELIRRLVDEGEPSGKRDYFFYTIDSSRRVYSTSHRRNVSIGIVRGREYQEMLGRLIARRMRCWWD